MPPGADMRLLQALWNAIDKAGGFDVVRLNQVRPDGRVKQLLDSTVTGRGKLKLRELVSRTYALGDVNDALAALARADGARGVIRW